MITGKGCKIGNLKILGKGEIILGDGVIIGDNVIINVSEMLMIGDRSIIGDNFVIEGRYIKIGKEFWSGRNCQIGGGSCQEKASSLTIGDQCHLGNYGSINTARKVIIGNEVGLGEGTKVYTHGAYLSFLDGFPAEFGSITIEDRVWCPNAMIMPNVTIGHDTVVGAGAIITKNLPSGCLAVGIPAKVIKENCYPKKLSDEEFQSKMNEFITHFKNDIVDIEIMKMYEGPFKQRVVYVGHRLTKFDFENMSIDGPATEGTEKFKNELRRYGVRFKYYNNDGAYVAW